MSTFRFSVSPAFDKSIAATGTASALSSTFPFSARPALLRGGLISRHGYCVAMAENEVRPLCENNDGIVYKDVTTALQQRTELLPTSSTFPFSARPALLRGGLISRHGYCMAMAENEVRPLCENDHGTISKDVTRALQQRAELLPT